MTGAGTTARYRDCYVEVPDGLRLYFRDYPGAADRPPLLCLHGLTRNSRDFAEFAERHSPEFRVIALDFRGRGASGYDPVPARYTPPVYAGDVQHVLDQLGIERAIFVGTSLGGLVTMAMAVIAPHRIQAAILNDVGPDLNRPGLDRIQSYVGKDRRFAGWDDAAAGIRAILAEVHPNYSADDWMAMARRTCREDGGAIRFDYDMAIVEPFNTAGPVPKIDMWPLFMALAQKPLLLVRGELSELLSAASAEAMRQAAPSMAYVEVPAVGHAPDLSEPAAAAAIDRFLASVVDSAPAG